ncbi:P-loop containing nucleoside triphosphate hydrolase protein [Fistulina hepatica ATCC 64428]|uniref:p-loop containing nucleoside triphosphate hydrolase protein n=1 Tax=Fistulina hepatica ATCC 64428 TaxID=1128425 RepID=A0A0D7A3L5_9AGAR|nr:P-loop containing nucleoside triphosphate hydrolase protein [Fistulina hepatica ATCC 64428]
MVKRNPNLLSFEPSHLPDTRGYQQELLEQSLKRNIIIALDTGAGKTHVAVLRIKSEVERQSSKACLVAWFVAPTVALCAQQHGVIQRNLSVPVAFVSGSLEPDQWKDQGLWERVITTHRVMVTTPQVLLDASRHGYVIMSRDISLLVFDEAHHAVDKHPYNLIMKEFYFDCETKPAVLGLTASPIFGGNVVKAFGTIEKNLDAAIYSPRLHQDELAKFVHKPKFNHVLYGLPDEDDISTNLATLEFIVSNLDIREDPWVVMMRKKLEHTSQDAAEYRRIDQQLSKVIYKKSTFTHRGLNDFVRTGKDLQRDMGSWAADWFIEIVLKQYEEMMREGSNILASWKRSEKSYLSTTLRRVTVCNVSRLPDDILEGVTPKVHALVDVLLNEKANAEQDDDVFSGIVFVQRRDAVFTLAEILSSHPKVQDNFRIGCLIGMSESSFRHSFLDITRSLAKQSQEETLMDFRIGEKNLLIATSVAEEGLDIQACGCVIRWDLPANMASWVQSRGRARRHRSSFTLMFPVWEDYETIIAKWKKQEADMVAQYDDMARISGNMINEDENYVEDDDLTFVEPSTGAKLTLHSAIPHLGHFCAMIPFSTHTDNRPLYDIDPPEMPLGWHSLENRETIAQPTLPPFGSKVTLPRCIPAELREYETQRIYRTKLSAHRHAAFHAYLKLYDAGLLNNNLMPLTSVLEPEKEEEVHELLKDVEKREGLVDVDSLQMNPWKFDSPNSWFVSELVIGWLPPLLLFTVTQPTEWTAEDGPTLCRPRQAPMQVLLRPLHSVFASNALQIDAARVYTRRLFWGFHGSRMDWNNLDFSYLFLPVDQEWDESWQSRRSWLANLLKSLDKLDADQTQVDAATFGKAFAYPNDLTCIKNGLKFGKAYRFVRWRHTPLSEKEMEELTGRYTILEYQQVSYPVLEVEAYPARTNFLLPVPPHDGPSPERRIELLLPEYSAVLLHSPAEIEYCFLLPCVLRSLALSMTMQTMRSTIFASTPLITIPLPLLTTALCAPVAQERTNYQRLETLGDTVLKYTAGLQLLADYPLWHEGYLSRKKDHAVSNVRLAKENIARGVYRFIIRDRLVGKKWKPSHASEIRPVASPETSERVEEDIQHDRPKQKKQQLSTKVLADVIESTIGAAYLHGGLSLSLECLKLFGMGLKWDSIPTRIETILSRTVELDEYPSILEDIERMLGYIFHRKSLLLEALTHASYQEESPISSYERLEFLGDSVLDMVVTDILYRSEKNYSPGHIMLRRSAVVNGSFLAYLCLRLFVTVEAQIPKPTPGVSNGIKLVSDNRKMYLWQCMQHSSPRILEDQTNSSARFRHVQAEVEGVLQTGKFFPWAALTQLQAPKFFSDIVESILGAIFLDSHGDLDVARRAMTVLGILPVLERIISDDVDVLHPVSRLGMWASRKEKELQYEYVQEKGCITCIISIDGEEEAIATHELRGRASRDEVRLEAAEKAVRQLHLRDPDSNYQEKKRRKTAKKHSGKTKGTIDASK